MPGPEAKLERKVAKYLEERGWECLKLIGPVGWPDRAVYGPHGLHVLVEFKSPYGRLARAQEFWRDRLTRLGHTVIVTKDFEHVTTTLEEMAECLRNEKQSNQPPSRPRG